MSMVQSSYRYVLCPLRCMILCTNHHSRRYAGTFAGIPRDRKVDRTKVLRKHAQLKVNTTGIVRARLNTISYAVLKEHFAHAFVARPRVILPRPGLLAVPLTPGNMAGNYINTPATERGDYTSISEKHVDFSFAQPFGSPSKNPAQDLRNHMKGMRSGTKPLQTPRVRNPLVDKRNPSGPQKQEFTPLLKSAKRNQLIRESILGEKENATSGPLETPAGFRSSYAGQALDLPASSSMMDDDISGNCDATPVAPAQSSSMMDSTPLPHLPDGGGAAMLDQGNMLSLRDQETKLDQIQKDNFGLKLKIHYLEQALDKTGTAFQQETLKENVELKTTKMTIEADLKRQRKRLQQAQLELEEYRQKFTTFEETVKKRHATQHKTEEFKRLQQIAEESQRVAKKREQELAAMQERVEEAEKEQQTAVAQQDPEELQRLRDDVLDLEAAVQDRDRQLDEKDEQLENLEGQLKSTKASTLEAEHLQQDIDELEAELKEKDACLQEKDAQLRERSFVIEQRDDELADLQHRLRTAESGTGSCCPGQRPSTR